MTHQPIMLKNMPEICLPALEFIDEIRPEIVCAIDRGGRFFGLSVFFGWKALHPGEPFPTSDKRLHFVKPFEEWSLGYQNPLLEDQLKKIDPEAKVLILDDRAKIGNTFFMVCRAMTEYGLESSNINLMTVYGDKISDPRHTVCGPEDPDFAIWDSFPSSVGVDLKDGKSARIADPDVRGFRLDLLKYFEIN